MTRKQPTVDALLFDFGGVLVSIDFGLAFASWAQAANVASDSIAARFVFDAAYQAHERGEIDGATYFAALRSTLGVALSDEQLLAGWNAIFLAPMPGVADLLLLLSARMPLYLFSNTNRLHQQCWSARYCELLAPLTGIYCSHEVGERKPNVQAFVSVARRIGLPPHRIAFFDDLAENVLGARKAGLLGFQVTSVADLRAALVDELHIDAAR
jgi:HAD superfamily hydrolase (TIGR01509 family)